VRRIEVSSLTTPRERGVVNGVFYLAGALVGFCAAVDPAAARGPVLGISAAAVVVGLLSIGVAHAFTPARTHAVVALAPPLIAAAIVAAGGGFGSVLLMADFVLVSMFMALLGSPRAIGAHIGWVVAWVAASTVWPAGTALPVVGASLSVIGATTVVAALLSRAMRTSATTDPLTGAINRGGFDAALAEAVLTAERTGGSLSLLLLDLDGFKQINDRRGHAAGDALLRAAARAWTAVLSDRDTLARLGGDEFAVIRPEADRAGTARLAARLSVATPEVTCSVGIARWGPGQDAEALLAAADAHLYLQKRQRQARRPTDAGGRPTPVGSGVAG
jgi:diguanylate cyclase (GGDEF)-like protein